MTNPKVNISDKKGIKGFLCNNVFVIIAFLLPMLIMAACFVVNKIAPFGTNMVMVSDAWHQYYPFLREYQSMLKEGVAPLYSWNTGGGSAFLGVIGNYLASPLYFFTAFLPEGHFWLESYLAFTVVLRIGFAGGFMALFLRKIFERNDLSLVYFSLMYAFCGFIMGYYWNFMWLDTMAMLPLVVAGVYSVLKEGRFSLYIISLALSVICNFYIGYFVCIFVLLFSICYTIVNFVSFKHSFKNAGKMIAFTLIAFMLTAFITIPTFMALGHSDSSADVAGFPLKYTVNYGFGYGKSSSLTDTLKAIARTVTNLLSFTRPIKLDEGAPNIFCGALSLILAVFYFTTKKIRLKEKIVSLSLVVFFILSFVVNQLNYIWHGMNTPAMVYYRFSFLFSFVLIVLAYRAFCLVDDFGKKTFIASGVLLIMYLVLAFFFQRKISVAITAAAVAVVFAGLILYRKGKLSYRVLSLLLCAFVVCEMGLSAFYGSRVVNFSRGENFPKQDDSVKILASKAEENSADDEMYRTEFISSYNLNDGALYSLYGVSTFNSMCRMDYTDFFTELGLAASKGNNRYQYLENTPVANLFLNIKYLIGRADKKDGKLIPEVIADGTYMKEISEKNSSILYENTAYIPMGFMAQESLLQYKLHPNSVVPMDAQNELFSLATGVDKDVLVPVEASGVSGTDMSKLTLKEGLDHYYTYKRTATEDEILTVEYEIEESGSYYGFFRTASKDGFRLSCGEREILDDENYTHIVTIGSCSKGDVLKAELPIIKTDNGYVGYYLYRLDKEVFEEGYKKLYDGSSMKLTEKGSRGLKGTIDVKEEGLFYTSVLFDEGWRAFIDGKEVEITPVADTFCAFKLSEGHHEIEFVYTPQGLYLGIGVSALGVVSFAVLAFVARKKRRK